MRNLKTGISCKSRNSSHVYSAKCRHDIFVLTNGKDICTGFIGIAYKIRIEKSVQTGLQKIPNAKSNVMCIC